MSASGQPELPPVPFQFIAQPELYHMAVRLYLDTVVTRALEAAKPARPGTKHITGILQQDAVALNAAHDRGETP